MIAFFEDLLVHYGGRPVLVILDHASIHKSRALREWLSEHPQLELIYLPRYGGHQDNPIEKITKITDKVDDILSLPELEMAQQAYPELNIQSEPAYILFDQTGIVHQSKELGELTTFLGENSPK